jgi:Hypothetical protein (DUF2513)
MKRDMDLVREILLKIEDLPSYEEPVDIEIERYSEENIQFHLKQLQEANLIEVPDIGLSTSWAKVNIMPTRLTWQGSEFLDSIRNENVWKKTKEFIAKNGGGFVLSVVKDLAVSYLRQEMGLS